VLAYPYQLGQSKIDAQPRLLTALPGGPINHHWTKDLALSPDGRYLYASVGSNSNAGERGLEAEKGRAAIWQIDRETGAARIFASGLRNPNGLNIHPETGELWTVVNERDELGPNLVPDYLTSVRDGGFYGWPWSYFGQHVDVRVRPERPDLVQAAIKPDYALTSHVAALGLAFTTDSAMPEAYRNGAFVGNRGSWNRKVFNGYKVIYVPFQNGKPSGMPVDVVTGFLNGDEVRGRPVGLAIDGTGALLIADDAGNTVWRVASADGAVTPQPIPTDRVTTEPQSAIAPPQPGQGEAPTGSIATPPQTGIAPAIGPEDATDVRQPETPAQAQ
jgi:glucose/arabinose dehydrogenase